MKINSKQEFDKQNLFGLGKENTAFAQYFLGNSYLNPLTVPGKTAVFLANVTFEPGCRNNWHIHHAKSGGGQLLICIAGSDWYQEEGKEAISLEPGMVITIPAEVKHWHGAKADSWFSHIAVEVPGEQTQNEWCEPVTEEEYKKLAWHGGKSMNLQQSDPEFFTIMENFTKEVDSKTTLLDNKQKQLIKIVSLVTQQSKALLAEQIKNAISSGLTAIEIKEAIYQCAPYSGFPRTVDAIYLANDILEQNNIVLPLEKQSTVTQQTRFDKGLTAQTTIFGNAMKAVANGENTLNPAYYLITNCFGDYYTRNGLDLQTREMLTLCILINLGTENQIKAHISGNSNMGRSKAFLEEIIYQCLPYAGYPRTLNALSCLKKVLPD